MLRHWIFAKSVFILLVVVLTSAVHFDDSRAAENGCSFDDWNKSADCSHRRLSRAPLDLPSTLEYLDLSYNDITAESLPIMRRLTSLRTLKLSYNRIINLPAHGLSSLVNLTALDLSFNGIKTLHTDVFNGLINLEYLILKENPLEFIEENSFETLPSLNFLYIDSIALHCECKLIWLSKWLKSKQRKGDSNFADWDRVLCYHPQLDTNIKLVDLHYKTDKDSFGCVESKMKRPRRAASRLLSYWSCLGSNVVPLYTEASSVTDIILCSTLCVAAHDHYAVIVASACLCGKKTSSSFKTSSGCKVKCKDAGSSSCLTYILPNLLSNANITATSTISMLQSTTRNQDITSRTTSLVQSVSTQWSLISGSTILPQNGAISSSRATASTSQLRSNAIQPSNTTYTSGLHISTMQPSNISSMSRPQSSVNQPSNTIATSDLQTSSIQTSNTNAAGDMQTITLQPSNAFSIILLETTTNFPVFPNSVNSLQHSMESTDGLSSAKDPTAMCLQCKMDSTVLPPQISPSELLSEHLELTSSEVAPSIAQPSFIIQNQITSSMETVSVPNPPSSYVPSDIHSATTDAENVITPIAPGVSKSSITRKVDSMSSKALSVGIKAATTVQGSPSKISSSIPMLDSITSKEINFTSIDVTSSGSAVQATPVIPYTTILRNDTRSHSSYDLKATDFVSGISVDKSTAYTSPRTSYNPTTSFSMPSISMTTGVVQEIPTVTEIGHRSTRDISSSVVDDSGAYVKRLSNDGVVFEFPGSVEVTLRVTFEQHGNIKSVTHRMRKNALLSPMNSGVQILNRNSIAVTENQVVNVSVSFSGDDTITTVSLFFQGRSTNLSHTKCDASLPVCAVSPVISKPSSLSTLLNMSIAGPSTIQMKFYDEEDIVGKLSVNFTVVQPLISMPILLTPLSEYEPTMEKLTFAFNSSSSHVEASWVVYDSSSTVVSQRSTQCSDNCPGHISCSNFAAKQCILFADFTLSYSGKYKVVVNFTNIATISAWSYSFSFIAESRVSNLRILSCDFNANIMKPKIFTANHFGDRQYISWYVNDIKQSSMSSFNYTFSENGTFSVAVTVGNHLGNVTTKKAVTVLEYGSIHGLSIKHPRSNEYFATLKTISFEINLCDGESPNLFWLFGDGKNETTALEIVTHVYNLPGRYLIKVDATNSRAQVENATVTINLQDEIKNFTAQMTKTIVKVNEQFYVNVGIDKGTDVRYQVKIGSKIVKSSSLLSQTLTISKANIVDYIIHAYNYVSSKELPLRVTAQEAIDFIISKLMYRPLASRETFTVNKQSGTDMYAKWDFGDGNETSWIYLGAATPSTSHTYSAEGLYVLVVNATNNVSSSSVSSIILVERPLHAVDNRFLVTAKQFVATNESFVVSFTIDYSSAYGYNISGSTDFFLTNQSRQVNFSFNKPHSNTLTFTASNHVSSLSQTIIVISQDKISGNILASPFYVPQFITSRITASVYGTDPQYSWIFEDGTKLIGSKVDYNFTRLGRTSANVTAFNNISSVTSKLAFQVEISIRDLSVRTNSSIAAVNTAVLLSSSLPSRPEHVYVWRISDHNANISRDEVIWYFPNVSLQRISLNVSNHVSHKLAWTFIEIQQPVSDIKIVLQNNFTVIPFNETVTLKAVVTSGSNLTFSWNSHLGNLISRSPFFDITVSDTSSYHVEASVDVSNNVSTKSAKTVIPVEQRLSGVSIHAESIHLILNTQVNFTIKYRSGSNFSVLWRVNGSFSGSDTILRTNFSKTGQFVIHVTVSNTLNFKTAEKIVYVHELIDFLQLKPAVAITGQETEFSFTALKGTDVKFNWTIPSNVRAAPIIGMRRNLTFRSSGIYTLSLHAMNIVHKTSKSFLILAQDVVLGPKILHNRSYYPSLKTAMFNGTVNRGTNVTFSWDVYLQPNGPHCYYRDQSILHHHFNTSGNYKITVNASNLVSSQMKSVSICVQDVVEITALMSNFGTFLPTRRNITLMSEVKGTNVTTNFTVNREKLTNLSRSGLSISFVVLRPTTIIVEISVENRVSITSKNFSFEAQDEIRKLSIWTSVKTIPEKTSLDFRALTSSGSNISYIWQINSTTKSIDPKGSFQYRFAMVGFYEVRAIAANDLLNSTSTSYIIIDVQRAECEPPRVVIVGARKRQLLKSKWFYAEASIDYNCSSSSVVSRWSLKIAQINTNCLVEQGNLEDYKPTNNLTLDFTAPLLAVEPCGINVGMYCLCYTAYYGKNGKFRFTDAILLQVIPTPLIPIIIGGSSRPVGNNQTVLLDASESIDPDVSNQQAASHLYKWQCYCEPKNSSISSLDTDCKNSSWSVEKQFLIPPGMLSLNCNYVYILSVKRIGGRPVSITQKLIVVPGRTLDIMIDCITCKAYRTVRYTKNRELKLLGVCKSCKNEFAYLQKFTFIWKISLKNGSVVQLIKKISQEYSDVVILKPNTFNGIDEYDITLVVNVTAESTSIRGASLLLLKPNNPPRNGSCSISPLIGTTLVTQFTFKCKGWKDEDNIGSPFLYQLNSQGTHGSWDILYRGTQSSRALNLPMGDSKNDGGLRLQILVEDSYGAFATGLERTVKVLAPVVDNVGSFLETHVVSKLSFLTRENDLNKVVITSQSSAKLLSESGNIGRMESDILSNITRSTSTMTASSLENIEQLSGTLKFSINLLDVNAVLQQTRTTLTTSLEKMTNKVDNWADRGQLASKSSLDSLLFLAQDNIAAASYRNENVSTRSRRSIPSSPSQLRKNLNIAMIIYSSILRASIRGQGPTQITTKYGTVALKRTRSSSIDKIQTGDGCSFFLNHSIGAYEDVFKIFNTSRTVPYQTPVTTKIASKVAGLSFSLPNGTEISVKHLSLNESILVKLDRSLNIKTKPTVATRVIPGNGKVEGELIFKTADVNSSSVFVEVLINSGKESSIEAYISLGKIAADDEKQYLLKRSISGESGKFVKFFAQGVYRTNSKYYIKLRNKDESQAANVSVLMYALSCVYWNRTTQQWSMEGTTATEHSTLTHTVCRSSHLTEFASTFNIAPNPIKWSTLNDLDIEKNPIAIAICMALIVVYLMSLFFASRKDEEDRREAQYIPLMGPDEYFKYEIRIKTGAFFGSGTTANVGVQIFASKCTTKPIVLAKEGGFQRNSVELFRFASPSRLGKIWRIRVWHDNSGSNPSWYISRIVVKNCLNGQKYFFFCNRWLATDRDDGEIERTFAVADAKMMAKFNTIFNDIVGRTFTDYHLWVSIFEKPKLSRFTRVQRLTCCITFLLTWMCVDAMWYGTLREGKVDLYLGFKGYSYEEVLVGAISSLMVFPINMILILIFRNCRLPKSRRILDGEDEVTIHVISGNRRARRLSEDWVEIEDITDVGQTFGTSLPRCGGLFKPSLYQPLLAVDEREQHMMLDTFSDEEQVEDEVYTATVDTDQSNIKSQRSYLTYGQRPCRIHFEQSDGGGDMYSEEESLVPRFLPRKNPKSYARVPVPFEVSENPVLAKQMILRERSGSLPSNDNFSMSTAQTRLTAKSSARTIPPDRIEEMPDESAIIQQRFLEETLERRKSTISEQQLASIVSQINSKPAYNGNSYVSKNKNSAKYQDIHDSFSSRHSSRITSASTGKTTSDPHIETNFVSDGEEEEAKDIPDIKELHQSLECLLPSWFVVVAYFGCLGISVLSFIIILIYGRQFGKEKALKWLSSIFVGLFQDIFFTYPILLVAAAIFVALLRRPMNLDYSDFVTCPVVPGDANATATPVRGYALELAQKKGRGKRQLRRVIKNAVFQIIHLWLLFSICLTSYESNMTAVRENFESRIVSGGTGIAKINSISKIWSWAETDLPKFLYPSAAEEWVLRSDPRLRQIRIRSSSCPVPSAVHTINMSQTCNPEYSEDNLETKEFVNSWARTGQSWNNPWAFVTETELNGSSYFGEFASYPHSGYFTYLGKTKTDLADRVQRIKAAGWLDSNTRAAFVEFTMQNININKYVAIAVAFEMSATGLILPKLETLYFRIHMYTRNIDYFRLFCEVIFGLLTFYMLWCIQHKARRKGWKMFDKFWNIHLIFTFFASAGVVGLSIYRLLLFLRVRPFLKKGVPQGYDLRHEAIIEWAVRACLGFVCFLMIIKLIVLLCWTRAYGTIGATLRRVAYYFLTVTAGFIIVLVAFASWGYLAFGAYCYNFHTFWRSFLYTFLFHLWDMSDMDGSVKQSHLFRAWSSLYTFIILAFVLSLFRATICAYFKNGKIIYLSGHQRLHKEFIKYLYNRFTQRKKKSTKRVKFSITVPKRKDTLAMSQQTISLGSDQWLSAHGMASYSHVPRYFRERQLSRLTPSTDEILCYVQQLEHDEFLEDEFYSKLENLASATRNQRMFRE